MLTPEIKPYGLKSVVEREKAAPSRSRRLMRCAINGIQDMYPGYFAMVMATGIISNAFFLLGLRGISQFLLWVNLIAYPILVFTLIARAFYFKTLLWADLINPALVFSFFTFVAGSNVLGIQFFLRHHEHIAIALWLLALTVWIFMSYFSFSVLTFMGSPRGVDVVHGGWLIAIVGTQSLVLLGTLLAPRFGSFAPLTFLATHSVWGVGVVLYGIFITLFSYRIFFVRLDPHEMHPLFWVVMGAAAISTNAGSCLIMCAPMVPFLTTLRPFVEGATLILWAWSTWLIPLLVVFGVWRHIIRKVPLIYHPMYWSLVFPLGMYAVATYRLSLAADYAPLRAIPQVMVWIAFAAWIVTMLGLLHRLVRVALTAYRGTRLT